MAHLITNSFSSYSLTDEEVMEGSVLTVTQVQVIQNQIAVIAECKIAIQYDLANPNTFVEQEAHARGQIEALQHLLDVSNACIEARVEHPPE